ncbi:MAG: 1-acyl-sn-glycerol-3-phosphate acyltransferase [Marinobacter sp.]|uniref:1-acyl-sn-glycerol-3-phosphate acyltransferase n=1 Tax=Marinobacter sp. TaxID=50741 RepID=UPI00299D3742|nr:1-acyl-sn-glycerol-3-phosphate acyltransferase [Marinobacter sp.]MDX1634105.1 1-acyl-sn-glycerol-3-phosphate acyltransferase [Marinobacter sp.]
MQEFDAIRPYGDAETQDAIARLLQDDGFLDMVARFKSPTLSRWFPGLVRRQVQRWLKERFGDATTIEDIQGRLSTYVGQLVDNTTTRVTCSGLDALDPDRAHLFISNHRDIVFDPMVVNYLLFTRGFHTTRIAIGDNLLQNRVFAELMRLNKSFVVRRNIPSPREMRDAYLTLSAFINHSIDTNESIWIAQREGRAKDGIDGTDPAITKMFYMHRKKSGEGFAEAMNKLNIVPVSIAYEYDPCDADKARELEIRQRTGSYTKAPNEDSDQIVKGLTGFKGHVHVHFGQRIAEAPDSARELAQMIDQDMHTHYHLHASNLVAYNQLAVHPDAHELPERSRDTVVTAEAWTPAELEAAEAEMNRRLEACDPAYRPFLLAMYANPVISALKARAD